MPLLPPPTVAGAIVLYARVPTRCCHVGTRGQATFSHARRSCYDRRPKATTIAVSCVSAVGHPARLPLTPSTTARHAVPLHERAAGGAAGRAEQSVGPTAA